MKLLFFVEQPYSFPILKPIQEECDKLGIEVAWFLYRLPESWLDSSDQVVRSTAEVKRFNPTAVVCPGNWVPFYWPGIKVQVFHGFGIEKKGHFRIRGFFDLYCTHGPITTEWYQREQSRSPHFRVVETGWPKLDHYDVTQSLMTQQKQQYRLLYAPTFSPSLTSTKDLFEPLAELAKRDDMDVVLKFHPMMARSIVQKYQDHKELLPFSGENDLCREILKADLVISDTSSAIVESMYFGKPVITYRTLKPSDHIYNIQSPNELEKAVEYCLENYQRQQKKGFDYVKKMHPYQDRRSSARVISAIKTFSKDGLAQLPVNVLRKLKVLLKNVK